jgi:dTDP-4-dehydrorhamnose reductase
MSEGNSSNLCSHVVLLGAGGMLGQSWLANLTDQPIFSKCCTTLSRNECDISKLADLECALQPDVDLVINCASYTDVDGAEENEDLATQVNGDAVGMLAQRCNTIGATLVHYSTDYVFDGQATSPYPTDQARDPVNAYGRSKARGEELLEQSGANFLLLRTSWLYAPTGKNFVTTIARLCRDKPSLKVVDDQFGRPTSAAQLVQTTRRLLQAGVRGVHHACDSGQCSWFEFAREIAAKVGPQCSIEPCSSAAFPRPADRPAYSVLDLTKTIDAIGPISDWRQSLESTLNHLPAPSTA